MMFIRSFPLKNRQLHLFLKKGRVNNNAATSTQFLSSIGARTHYSASVSSCSSLFPSSLVSSSKATLHRRRNPENRFIGNITSPTSFRSPTAKDVEMFRQFLQPKCVITDPEVMEKYNTDWTKHYKGCSDLVLLPGSAEDVSKILQYCSDEGLAVVPQGGNTGLVGGSVPLNTEIVISMERMNAIHSFDESTGILHCDAGCILENLQNFTKNECNNYLVPIDLGSKGTCQIGGNVSTNAGGSYYDRYGSLHANIIGLQVVVPLNGGQIFDLNINGATNRKDNTGYPMQHLFIGSEGTLGVVTQVAILCRKAPASRCVALAACTCFENVQKCLNIAKNTLNEILAAAEFMDNNIISLVVNKTAIGEKLASTIPQQDFLQEKKNLTYYPYYILIETHGSNNEHDMSKMETFLGRVMEQEIIADGVLAQDEKQIQDIWHLRESCNPAAATTGYTYKYDLSFPKLHHFEEFDKEMRQRLLPSQKNMKNTSEKIINDDTVVITNWGHIVDGNLHFNVTTPNKFVKDLSILEKLEPYIFESVVKRGGSISAEHGLGQYKNKYLPMMHKDAKIEVMNSIKQLFDPKGILNPGKFLP